MLLRLPARRLAVIALCVALSATVGLVALLHHDRRLPQARRQSTAAAISLAKIEREPHIVFRDTTVGPTYGRVSMVSLADPGGARTTVTTQCDRVYATRQKILCLSSDPGLDTTYKAEVTGPNFSPERTLPLVGIPSRARLSGDSRYAATTSFTAGDSYEATGFSTRTVITDLSRRTGGVDLETFSLLRNGVSINPADRNYWGVTFAAGDDLFYATVAFGGKTYLVRGSMALRSLTILHTDAECPSLSPDGTHLVYKKRAGQPAGHWRLASYDIATGRETMLAETRSVDDQVEWLNDTQVIYGVPRTGSQAAVDDVYAVSIDVPGIPELLIKHAWSPAVVR